MKGYNVKDDLRCRYRVSLELTLSANNLKYTLGSSQQLNKPSVKLFAIRIYPKSGVTVSPNGVTLASAAIHEKAYLTLQDPASNNVVQQDSMLYYEYNTDFKPDVPNFNGQQIDFTKSYIQFPSGTTLVDGTVYLIEVEYIDDTADFDPLTRKN